MERFKALLTISGRIGRSQYWAASFVAIAIFIACGAILDSLNPEWQTGTNAIEMWVVMPGFLLGTWIGLAASIKRLHDRAKSGLWLLLGLIPIVGDLWLFIELGFLAGTDFFNMYDEGNA